MALYRKKYEREKRAREAKFREIHSKTKHWTIAEIWKLVAQAESHLVEVERSLSYAKYTSEQQKVVLGGSTFEWQKEADFRKSDVLMGENSRAPRVDRGRTKKPPRTSPATPGINTVGESWVS